MSCTEHHSVIIIGAGPAGLAAATCLKAQGVTALIVEQSDRIAVKWHKHYDRLHLHTHRDYSALPEMPYPKDYPIFISRQQVLDYMESYAKKFDHKPRFGVKILNLAKQGEIWFLKTNKGFLSADHVIVATGRNRSPKNKELPELKKYTGQVIHSAHYRNGKELKGKNVLVIGAGNTGAEIALDLAEHQAKSFLCVRSPTHVVPLNSMGSASQITNIRLSYLPISLTDPITKIFLKLKMGDLSKYGLIRPKEGTRAHMKRTGRVPIIDIGTIDAIKKGLIKVVKGLDQVDGRKVQFKGGYAQSFDAVVVATGYTPGLGEFLPNNKIYEDRFGIPRQDLAEMEDSEKIYFIGLRDEGTGVLYQINKRAYGLAERVAKSMKAYPSFVTKEIKGKNLETMSTRG